VNHSFINEPLIEIAVILNKFFLLILFILKIYNNNNDSSIYIYIYIYTHSVEMAVIFFKIVLLKCSNIKLTINKL
jgi:hypothetical protein